jgi:hypothetical protein
MADFVVFCSVGFSVSVAFGLFLAMVIPGVRAGGRLAGGGPVHRAAMAGLIMAAGPFLFARELARSGLRAEWPTHYFLAGAVICAIWSAIFGFTLCACFAP